MKKSTVLSIAAIMIGWSLGAGAQGFPAKPIRFIVPNPPGTSPDAVARIMSFEMAKTLGQPIVVENRPGADAMIGYEHVAKRVPADGYTAAVGAIQSLAIAPVAVKELRFDPFRDLTPVIGIVEGRLVLASAASLPWKSFNGMIAEMRANPGKYNYGSSSLSVKLATEAMLRRHGLDVTAIPFGGDGAARVRAVVAGEIHIGLIAEQFAISFGEKVRVLAVTGNRRTTAFPDVPTFGEVGLPDLKGVSYSLSVASATPREAVATLYASASQALRQASVRSQLEKIRMEVVEQSPEVAAKQLADEARFFAETARKLGLQAE